MSPYHLTVTSLSHVKPAIRYQRQTNLLIVKSGHSILTCCIEIYPKLIGLKAQFKSQYFCHCVWNESCSGIDICGNQQNLFWGGEELRNSAQHSTRIEIHLTLIKSFRTITRCCLPVTHFLHSVKDPHRVLPYSLGNTLAVIIRQ